MGAAAFDFDEWATLAQSAPDEFEQRRREYVEYLRSVSADIRRMRGLQCRIDMERIRANTAMKSCLRISTLMWDSFLDCRDAMEKLDTLVYSDLRLAKTSLRPVQSAQIILFQRKS